MRLPQIAFGAPPSRGRHLRPCEAGSALALAWTYAPLENVGEETLHV